MIAYPDDARTHAPQRPILGMGIGRVVAIGTIMASIMPLMVLHRYADHRIARWAIITPGSREHAFWKTVALLGQPLTWFVIAVLGFGVAAAFNWSNTARWMGMLGLSVLWAGLADIAVIGNPVGAATAGAIATVLSLWAPRAWGLWVGLALLCCVGQVITRGTSGTQTAMGALLGALGVLLVEYGWHHVAPDSPPHRNAPLRT